MLKEKIEAVIAETVFWEGPLESNTMLKNDLGFDSLSMVELIVKLEETLNIQFRESDLDPQNIETVGDIYQLITNYVEETDHDAL